MEIWKDISGYEGHYVISNKGRVKGLERKIVNRGRIQTKRESILTPFISGGYLSVILHKNSKGKTFKVHRLVASEFIKNVNGYKEVNHIDENKLNNNMDNLEWCDRKQNINHGTRTLRASISNSKPVIGTRLDNKQTIFGINAVSLSELGFNHRHISECCRGKRKTHKNFTWEFI